MYSANRLYRPKCYRAKSYVQSLKCRLLYDTSELVSGMLAKEYLDDDSILNARSLDTTYTPLDKVAKKSYRRRSKF